MNLLKYIFVFQKGFWYQNCIFSSATNFDTLHLVIWKIFFMKYSIEIVFKKLKKLFIDWNCEEWNYQNIFLFFGWYQDCIFKSRNYCIACNSKICRCLHKIPEMNLLKCIFAFFPHDFSTKTAFLWNFRQQAYHVNFHL